MGLAQQYTEQMKGIFSSPTGKAGAGKASGLQVALRSEKPVPGSSVTAQMARDFINSKTRVSTSDVYKSRLPAGTPDASEGGMGLIMKIHTHDEGCVCDVLWDTGKAFGGYCVGYRGFHDLLVADTTSSRPKLETPPKAARTPTDQDVSGEEPAIEVAVGYLASAPRVTHVGGKHIWSSEGPLFNKE
eukprot:387113-Rhodomonas_salina.1